MTIPEFIEAAIDGEYFSSGMVGQKPKYVVWKDSIAYGIYWIRWDTFPAQPMEGKRVDIHWMFLDPEAWKAVGRVKGWKQPFKTRVWFWKNYGSLGEFCSPDVYVNKMHDMVDALTEGVTLEEYIATL